MTVIIESGATDTDMPMVLYENLYTLGTISGVSDADYPASNVATGTTWDFWYSSDTGAVGPTVVLDDDYTADCAFIDAHDMATAGASFRVQYSTDGGSTWNNITSFEVPPDNGAILVLFPEVEGDAFRIQRNLAGAFIGVVMIGQRLVFPNGVDNGHTAINHSRVIDVLGGDSLSGQFTGQQIIKRSASTTVTFPLLSAEWVDNDMAMFEAHYNDALPFVYATSPENYPDDMGYCQRPSGSGTLGPSYFEGGLYEEFNMPLAVYQNV